MTPELDEQSIDLNQVQPVPEYEAPKWPFNPFGSGTLQKIAGYKQENHWLDLKKFLIFQLQETIELVSAFNARDQLEFRDATADVRVLLDAQAAAVTWNLSNDYNEVVNKLYTRFDKTEADALLTQQKYADIGVETYIVHDPITLLYVNRVKSTVQGEDGENYPEGKWLKSVNFKTPEFVSVPMSAEDDGSKITTVRNQDTYAFFGTLEEIQAQLDLLKEQA